MNILLRPAFLAALALTLAGGLVMAGRAAACTPELIDAALGEADGQLGYAINAASLDAARTHLRRVAFTMAEAEVQMITCGCPNAPQEAAATAVEARRAAAALEFDQLEVAVEATVGRFQRTLMAMEYDICR